MTAFRKIHISPNCTTVHQRFYESVEEGDDYRSEEDIYTGNSQSSSSSAFSPDTSEALNLEAMSRKRAVSDCEYNRSPAEFKRARATTSLNPKTPLEQPICFILPEAIWANIFSLLPPAELGRQRRTCKLFKCYLDNENIWQRSRKRFLPDHPKPVFGLAEWEMLSLILGTGCMLCEKGASRREHSSSPPNVKVRKAVIYWPFRVRCCKVCLEENTTKEFLLHSSKSFPDVLLTPLPFGIVDLRNNWISNSTHYQPNIGLTRIFWNADIQDMLERYQEAKDMRAQEEWLKGLKAEGMAHKLDIIRIERFENMQINGSDSRSAYAGGSYPGGNSAELGLLQGEFLQKEYTVQPGNIHNDDQCREGPALHQNPSVNLDNNSVTKSSAVSIESKAGLLLCEPESASGVKNYFKQFDSSQVSGSVQVEHTVHEALEVKSKRRADIEFRCLQMRPFLKPELLAQLPAFQAAIKIPLPLTEHAWENLKVKLLKQISDEYEQGYGKTGPLKIKLLHEDRKILEQKQKEAKERKEIEWDELQVPVRARLIIYADEITKHWLGCITKDTAPKFAVDVLSYCRRRFYEETPYSTDDPYRINPLDTTTRVGKATLEVPTIRRLTLENMKFVFDNKIRPLTDQFGRELFACSGCEHNSRFYAFEGAIQHYAAKHTSQLSFGSIVVHWRADWPEKLPFKLDHPISYPTAVPFFQSDMNISQWQFYPSLQTSITHQLPGIFAPVSVGLHTSHAAYNFSNYSGYNYPPHHRQSHQGIPQSESISQTHCIYLEQIAQDSRSAWFQLSGIKDLPSSVRVHYLISKIVPSFQNKFSCEPSLAVFIEALKEYKSLKPIRNTNGLLCLECYKSPPPPTAEGNIRAGRLFTFSALLQHFETIHILRNRAMTKPDWKTEMVKLPEARVIGMISQAQGMDVEKYSLLKSVFPLAFPLPFHGVNSSGIINEATCGVPSEGHINIDICNPLKEIGSEQKGIRLNNHKEMSTAPARTNHSPQQDLHIGIDCQRPSYVNSNGHRCRSLKKIHEPELQTKSPQCADKSEMTAAELFLENFLRNTGDNLQLDRKKEEEIAHTSVVISEKAHDSSAYSPDPYYQGDRDNILEHDRSSLQITPNKPRKHNLPIEPPASRSNQHDRRSMPRCARSKCPISQNMFRLPETALHKISYLRNSPTASCHTSKRSHDIDDYKTLRQQSAYLKEKYSEPLYLKESNKYYDTKYTLPSPASPPRPPPPQPLPSSYYSLKSYKSYRGTEWSHIPPLVYPAPPLPSTIPSGTL
ncbi:uncharacterized protein LAJ45_10885 [Morchella importuna]|uniref:uncharacterized protein n=1 Tax=Morchella importuna TaxID=1174673 RepID=UPI001E8E947C|nr:uncharacterized protein LAJ45_10885 [Morchella importuna]KAH8145105.1 hypothetical protein LAJ45_10885 [Morchella importuna]